MSYVREPAENVEGGIAVRTLLTLVGMGIWVLGASPLVWAQETGSVTLSACLACHGGTAAAAPGTPPFPKLDGQHVGYLDKQLREYRSKKRKSFSMDSVFASLTKQQIPALAAHFASQQPARGTVENPQLAARGKVLYEEGNSATGLPGCIGCHQANAVGTARYPRLAGQLQAYTVQQLMDFKSGARSNDPAGVMRAVAGRLTDDEMKAVAEYVAGLR
jgi:cytochrome c553